MHLAEVIRLRAVPASAVFLALTQRCPLSCRHCGTNSALSSPDLPTDPFRRLVATFTAQSHPELVVMSGGEALLRAGLVRWIAETARDVGTRSYLLSGMYFARERKIPSSVRRAIDAVDHFAASIDAFHEEEVPRADVIRVLRELVDAGKDVSIQLVGLSDEDPYVIEAVQDLRDRLDDQVPILVGHVGAYGRAAEWMESRPATSSAGKSEPCMLASWPLVTYDGTVVACCNQEVIDAGDVPPHLRLGHASEDSWETIRARTLSRDLLSNPGSACGYCQACYQLSDDSAAQARAADLVASPTIAVVEATVTAMLDEAGPAQFVRTYGSPKYAELVVLGTAARRELVCDG
jgi:MoaA/NifB/PqqE/SkfB family radical SAM enzyme